MAKKISELPSTTTPPSTVEIAVVDAGTTKKTTAANLADAIINTRLGWFDVGHGGGPQETIATAETQLLVDAESGVMGGYDSLPEGVTPSMVYEAGTSGATSKIKTDWLETGQAIIFRVTGNATTSTSNTAINLLFKFFDINDDPTFTIERSAGFFKTATTSAFSATELFFVSPVLSADGAYGEVYLQFDSSTGTNNAIQMGGFTLAVVY